MKKEGIGENTKETSIGGSMNLEKYEWTQIQAALLFWAHAAEYSSVHPSKHPRIQSLGLGDGLTNERVIELANRDYLEVIGVK